MTLEKKILMKIIEKLSDHDPEVAKQIINNCPIIFHMDANKQGVYYNGMLLRIDTKEPVVEDFDPAKIAFFQVTTNPDLSDYSAEIKKLEDQIRIYEKQLISVAKEARDVQQAAKFIDDKPDFNEDKLL